MKYSLLLSSLLMIQPVVAEDQHRQHDAHVHGHAQLNLVVSGQTLQVELETPSNNLLGFEHQARSEQDKKTLQQALAVLNDPSKWFQPDAAASCKLQDIDIESALLESDHHDEHDHDEHEKHAKHDDHDDHGHDHHDDDDKHAKHDDHDHDDDDDKHAKHDDHDKHAKHDDHDHADHDDEMHSEFDITLSFTCARPGRLKSVDARGLFQRFRNMEDIDVQWITDSKQSATELSRGKGIISLQ
ncbi:MAG: DUF2796 domain-containing protein [Gammaproteobacteria bacterium]|nr:DUF2796 domain-containing protein [Gammaproteobacteria bacterium]